MKNTGCTDYLGTTRRPGFDDTNPQTQMMEAESILLSAVPSDVSNVDSNTWAGIDHLDSAVAARCQSKRIYEDFPEDSQYLRQPCTSLDQQPYWNVKPSDVHMSSASDTSVMQPAPPSSQGPTKERPQDPNRSVHSMQSWLSSVLVTPFANFSGRPRSQISVPIRFHADLATSPALLFFIMFGDESSPATLATPRHRNSNADYLLTACIPVLDPYMASNRIPLFIAAENNNGDTMFHRELGNYVYMAEPEQTTFDISRKRRLSDGLLEDEISQISSWKRPKIQVSGAGSMMNHSAQDTQLFTPSLYHSTPIPDQNSGHLRPQNLNRGYLTPETRFKNTYRPTASSQYDLTPLTRSISQGSYPAFASLYPSPAPTIDRSSSQHMNFSYSPSLAGPLFPTASMAHSFQSRKNHRLDPSGTTGRTGAKGQTRPSLAITGDLDSMLDGWSEQEVTANRRLVVFEHSRSGNTVSVSFKAVTPEEWSPASACVSCIWWEEKEGGYITSVDTIALAETLCGYRFNVPVKNRIRRNLEGYKPITVAKDKAESEDFFKVVMGFPTPKPRNIEKHIKVFPWKSLSRALKKIIGKYGGTCNSPMHMNADSYNGGKTSEQYLQANFSPASVSSYEFSATGSSAGQAASRATESPYFEAAPPNYLDGGPLTSEHVPPEFPSVNLPSLPQDTFHGYHHYWRQQGESSDAVDYQWAMPSSYDPGLTATPSTDVSPYTTSQQPTGQLPPQLHISPSMLEHRYHGNAVPAYHRKTSSM